MLVVSVVVGAGGGGAQQGHSGEGSEQQALHRVCWSGVRVLEMALGCLMCCGLATLGSEWSDSRGRAPDQVVRSVGCSAGGGGWVVS